MSPDERNQLYSNLCAKLGDAYAKSMSYQEQIEVLLNEIKQLARGENEKSKESVAPGSSDGKS